MSFTDQQYHVATDAEVALFKRVKKSWRCGFCGHEFKSGDGYKWIYTNDTPGAGGNPFACGSCCDGKSREEMAGEYRQLRQEFNAHNNAAKFWSFRNRGE